MDADINLDLNTGLDQDLNLNPNVGLDDLDLELNLHLGPRSGPDLKQNLCFSFKNLFKLNESLALNVSVKSWYSDSISLLVLLILLE